MGRDRADIRIVAAVTIATMAAAIALGLVLGRIWVAGGGQEGPADEGLVRIDEPAPGPSASEEAADGGDEAAEDAGQEEGVQDGWLGRVEGAEHLASLTDAERASLGTAVKDWLEGQSRDLSSTTLVVRKDVEEVQIHEGEPAKICYMQVKGIKLWATCQLEGGKWSVAKLSEVIEGVNDDEVAKAVESASREERESRVTWADIDDTSELTRAIGAQAAANLGPMWREWSAENAKDVASMSEEGDYVGVPFEGISTSGSVTSFRVVCYHQGQEAASFDAQYDSSDNSYAFGRR